MSLASREIAVARDVAAAERRRDAALKFTPLVLDPRGDSGDDYVTAIRRAGFTEGEVADTVARTALSTFTNYFNEAAGVEVDSPRVLLAREAPAAKR